MAIQLPKGSEQPLKSIFSHSEDVDTGLGRERVGQASVIVSLDGSGDTDNIQDAINQLPPTGGAVYIKEGTYNILSTIEINKSNVQITGDGRAARLLNVGNYTTINVEDKENILITNIKIEGSTSAESTNKGIKLFNTPQSTIRDCNILNFGGEGIFVDGSNFINILNNEIRTCEREGILVGGDLLVISGNKIIGNKRHGISCLAMDRSVVISNVLLNNGTNGEEWDGIHLWLSKINTISSNTISTSRNYGIELENNCEDIVLIGNVIDFNVTGAVLDNGVNTLPNGATGTNNLALDDLNIIV